MTHHDMFNASDVESFASHLGLRGSDADLFYECYYSLDDKVEDWSWIMDDELRDLIPNN